MEIKKIIYYFVATLILCSKLINPVFAQEKEISEIDFKKGDILVRPNHNWLPGTEFVKNGSDFGHVAIVIQGASGTNPENVLSEIVIFESQARDVPREFQLRKVKGIETGNDYRFANLSFGEQYRGKRFRLRTELSEPQIDSVIHYILLQDNDFSSWRSIKNTSNSEKDKNYWYCSLLIYQAFKDVLKMDLDVNGGVIVFPNDIINHPVFNHKCGRLIF